MKKVFFILKLIFFMGIFGYASYVTFLHKDELTLDLITNFEIKHIENVLFLSILLILISIYNIGKEIYDFVEKEKEKQYIKHILEEIKDEVNSEEINLNKINSLKEKEKVFNLMKSAVKQYKKEKDAANRAKSLFLANISHEIRTPLNGIIGFIELLKSTTNLQDDQKEYVETIDKSSKQLLNIINNILDISKIESDKVALEYIPFDIHKEFNDLVSKNIDKVKEKHLMFNVFIDPSLPKSVKGDIIKVKDVLNNLLDNAIKFTDEYNSIALSIEKKRLTPEGVVIHFEVSDTGIGIDEKLKEKIFQEFEQADISETRQFGGVGLGLSITNKYLNLMNSKLHLESEVNEGSTFSFDIEFEVIEPKSIYEKDKFANLKLAFVNKENAQNKRVIFLRKYMKYLGVELVDFETPNELDELLNKVEVNYVISFFESLNDEFLRHIKLNNLEYFLIKVDWYDKQIEKFVYKPSGIIYIPFTVENIIDVLSSTKEDNEKMDVTITEGEKHYDLNVLVVEDNPINQKLIKMTLENLGMHVTLANNGKEGVEQYEFNNGDFDLIFMDIQMPVMDGIEATHKILEIERVEGLPHTPIIALTANALKGDRERFLAEGMDEYLTKPIIKEKLIQTLDKFAKKIQKPTEEEKDNEPIDLELEIEDKTEDKVIYILRDSVFKTKLLEKELQKIDNPHILEVKGFTNFDAMIALLATNLDTKKAYHVIITDEVFKGKSFDEFIKEVNEELKSINPSLESKLDLIKYILYVKDEKIIPNAEYTIKESKDKQKEVSTLIEYLNRE